MRTKKKSKISIAKELASLYRERRRKGGREGKGGGKERKFGFAYSLEKNTESGKGTDWQKYERNNVVLYIYACISGNFKRNV